MKKFSTIFLILLLGLVLSSCLTVEKKIYTFEMKDSKSGTMTIQYINILSMMDDTVDISSTDFDELISGYIEGDQIDQEYPDAIVRSKKLYEKDGELCAEVIIDFNNLRSVGLYQYDTKSPYMLNIGSYLESETYLNSNGEYGGDVMPVVFWPKSLKSFNLATYVTSPDETTLSLLAHYNNWK